MLDFTELGGDGRRLEQMSLRMLQVMNLRPQWSGVGPDAGQDLLFEEPGLAILRS